MKISWPCIKPSMAIVVQNKCLSLSFATNIILTEIFVSSYINYKHHIATVLILMNYTYLNGSL